jgi:penicillin-binding protein 1A
VITEGTGNPNADIGRPAAGKTGTTSSFRDAWFVGYTPDLVAAVWIGNDNYSRMNESYGGNIPARIWARFMKKALENTPKHDFVLPVGEVHKVKLCSTGKTEVFLAGTEPQHTCGTPDDTVTPRHGTRAAVTLPAPAAPVPIARALQLPPPVVPLTPPPDTIGDGQAYVQLGTGGTGTPSPR